MNTFSSSILMGLTILFTATVCFVWLSALIHCLRSDFRRSNDKTIWLLTVLLLPILGAVLYWGFAAESMNRRKKRSKSHSRKRSHFSFRLKRGAHVFRS